VQIHRLDGGVVIDEHRATPEPKWRPRTEELGAEPGEVRYLAAELDADRGTSIGSTAGRLGRLSLTVRWAAGIEPERETLDALDQPRISIDDGPHKLCVMDEVLARSGETLSALDGFAQNAQIRIVNRHLDTVEAYCRTIFWYLGDSIEESVGVRTGELDLETLGGFIKADEARTVELSSDLVGNRILRYVT